ncbi:class I SAM-dependent methyltransferase [Paenibacillus riograndensis]|nr:hypothetical protein [Paenibacillus riograndensis]
MMKMSGWLEERAVFLYKFLQSPRQIGSLAPSSAELAAVMTKHVPWHQIQGVAELGAGTGAISRYIQKSAPAGTKVMLFEKDPLLRKRLQRAFPGYACYPDCCKLELALHNENSGPLDCILSGLPFFNFPQSMRDLLMEQILSALKEDGLFIAFQYSKQMKKQLEQHFVIERICFVPRNLPPAFVYVCRKKRADL